MPEMAPRLTVRDVDNAMLTRHAHDKLQARGISMEEVTQILTEPHVVWGPDKKGRHTYARGELSVVVDTRPRPIVLITVLLRSQRQWDDQDARDRKV